MSLSAPVKRALLSVAIGLCGVIAVLGALLSVIGYEAIATGINPWGWISGFLVGVVLPLTVLVWCVRVARRMDRDGRHDA